MEEKNQNNKIVNFLKNKKRRIIIISIVLMALLSLLTNYVGSADIGDYADTAKFFAGDYQAKLRSSHEVSYGLLNAPLVWLTSSLIAMKFLSLVWLSLIIISIYFITKKNQQTLWLFVTAPIVWYMVPWITHAFLISLIFLWSWYFIEKFDKQEKPKYRYLIYSALLAGLASVFWTTCIYLSIFMLFSYIYNKKFIYSWIFAVAWVIGFLPRLIIDQILFSFAFYSTFKQLSSALVCALYGCVYGQGETLSNLPIVPVLFVLIFIPVFVYVFFKKQNFIELKKPIIFLTVSTLFLILNPQIRMMMALFPIIIILLSPKLTRKQFFVQISIFLILSILVINPYLLQIKYETNGEEFKSFILNLPNLQLTYPTTSSIIEKDLESIAEDYPGAIFVVGNKQDDYQKLAHIYWGDKIKEFVSIEDYILGVNGQSTIAKKTICSISKILNRRDICISIELRKFIQDSTDYEAIYYAIGLEDDLDLPEFDFEKKYQNLSVYKKS